MKTDDQKLSECFKAFLAQHEELTIINAAPMTQLLASEKALYSQLAIKFAITYLKEQQALEK